MPSLAQSIAGLMAHGQAYAEKIEAFRKAIVLTPSLSPLPDLLANLTLAQRSAEGAVDKLVRIMGDLPES